MSFFSNSLDRLMKDRNWSQVELERRSGITQSQISRYLKGVSPESEALEKLCKPFGDDTADLLRDWLRDLIPEALRPLLSITPMDSALVADAPAATDILEGLPPHARKVLTDLAAACGRRPEMVAAAESLLRISRPAEF